MNNYQLKDNLFVIGNKVISYETHVATIKDKQLIELGKYSRTTGKHISLVSKLMGLELVSSTSNMKGSFYKFDYGEKCKIDASLISTKTSMKIFNLLKDGNSYELALAILKDNIPAKDWDRLKGKNKIGKELAKGAKTLKRFGVL